MFVFSFFFLESPFAKRVDTSQSIWLAASRSHLMSCHPGGWLLCRTRTKCVSAMRDVRKQLICDCSALQSLLGGYACPQLCGKGLDFEGGRAFYKLNLLCQSFWKMCYVWWVPSVSFLVFMTRYQNQGPMHVRLALGHSWALIMFISHIPLLLYQDPFSFLWGKVSPLAQALLNSVYSWKCPQTCPLPPC